MQVSRITQDDRLLGVSRPQEPPPSRVAFVLPRQVEFGGDDFDQPGATLRTFRPGVLSDDLPRSHDRITCAVGVPSRWTGEQK